MTAYLPCVSTSSNTLRPVSIDFSLRAPLKTITNLSCYTAFLPSIPCNLIIMTIMTNENLLHFMVYNFFLHINCSTGQNSVKCTYYAVLQKRKQNYRLSLICIARWIKARFFNSAPSSLGFIPAL